VGGEVSTAFRGGLRGELPARYVAGTQQWRYVFDVHAQGAQQPGMDVLDVGAGRKPSIPLAERVDFASYVGLDISPEEMERAVAGSYDRTVVADICVFAPELEESFDLALSLFLLEHVPDVPAAIENMRRYLRPGGKLVAQLAGGRSVHGLVNRAIPHSLGRRVAYRAMRRSTHRAEDSVFPAHYDHCTPSALEPALAKWSKAEVIPQHTGVQYFLWSKYATAAYLAFEEAVRKRGWDDLATWHLIVATK
jgi:SAM-dependent methyltransferase